MRRLAWVLSLGASTVPALALGAPGCSYDWTYIEPLADAGDGGDGANAPDALPVPPEPEPPGPEPPPPPTTSCLTSEECPRDAYCHFEDGACGKGTPGGCVPIEPCKPAPTPDGCTCSGQPVADRCEAARLRDDLARAGSCGSGGDTFPCGTTRRCMRKTQYCVIKRPNPEGECLELPAECVGAGCACPALRSPSCTCSGVPDRGEATLTCS